VFPLRFIARHYPIRGQAHGTRKVFQERVGRFRADERARGWHVQYDAAEEGVSFIRDPSTLTPYDPDAVRVSLTLRHRGVEALETALEEARCAADALRREIESLNAAVVMARDEAQARGAEAASLRSEMDRQSAELAAARAEIAAVRREWDARSAEVARAVDFIAHQTRTIENMQHAIDDGARRIDALHRSLSWRLTAPARALLRAFTRR
jgi:hypothetical protein